MHTDYLRDDDDVGNDDGDDDGNNNDWDDDGEAGEDYSG